MVSRALRVVHAYADDTFVYADTFSSLTLLNPSNDGPQSYNFADTGIAWPGEAKKYAEKPGYNLSDILPPPNWALRFPNGYTEDLPPPNLKADEHFQNWMRTAGLPTFTKLYGRNDKDQLVKGTYQLVVNLSTILNLVLSADPE